MSEHIAESVADWHGWGTNDWSLHIGHLPGRKSLCLYYENGCIVDSLAYFRDEQSARVALAVIDRLVRGEAVAAARIDGEGGLMAQVKYDVTKAAQAAIENSTNATEIDVAAFLRSLLDQGYYLRHIDGTGTPGKADMGKPA